MARDWREQPSTEEYEGWLYSDVEPQSGLVRMLKEHVHALQGRIDKLPHPDNPTEINGWTTQCCCDYDYPGVVCGVHVKHVNPATDLCDCKGLCIFDDRGFGQSVEKCQDAQRRRNNGPDKSSDTQLFGSPCRICGPGYRVGITEGCSHRY